MALPAIDTYTELSQRLNKEFMKSQLSILNKLPVLVYTCDSSGYITSYNHATEEFWGRKIVLGKDKCFAVWKVNKENGDPVSIDRYIKDMGIENSSYQDEEVVIIENQNSNVMRVKPYIIFNYDDNGKFLGTTHALYNLTELRIIEEKQALLAAIVNTSDDTIISKTLDGIITSWNSTAEKMFGYNADEIIGRHVSILIPSDKIEEEDLMLIEVSKGNKIDHFETVRLTRIGEEIPVSLTVSPVMDNVNKIIGASLILRDINEKKKADKEQAILAAIVNNSDDAIISKTLDGIITSWNRGATQIFGYSVEEVIGKHISILIPPDRIAEEDVIIAKLTKGERIAHFETIRLTKDGSEIPLSISISPVMNIRGEIIGASKIAHDITERKKAEAINAKLYEEVKALSEKKDEFMSIASHELKTPITSIYGYLQLLDRMEEDPNKKIFVSKTLSQVQKLTTLVSDMLDISKIDAGKLQFTKENNELNLIINNAKELIEHTNVGTDISFISNTDEVFIFADAQRIEQVLINLLTNAIKYSSKQSNIVVELKKHSDHEVRVSVSDHGCGIPQEKIQNLFSKFYRVEEGDSTISGLGIGLYISRQIIERHEGSIWVESTVGEGSTFTFSLPLNP